MRYSRANVAVQGVGVQSVRVQRVEPQRRSLSRLENLERKNRILSVACYFGLAPFLFFTRVLRQQNKLVKHHLRYSLAFSFTIVFALVFNEVTTLIQYWLTIDVWNPTSIQFQSTPIPMWIICQTSVIALGLSVATWVAAFASSVIGAWRGHTPKIPGISWLVTKYSVLKIGVYWTLFAEVLAVATLFIAARSMRFVNAPPEKADVYVLYTVGGYIPAPGFESYTPPLWAVRLAFYPLIEAGMHKYGADSVRLLPLSTESFNEAIHFGRFIFVASHGGFSPGSFTVSMQPFAEYKPSDVPLGDVGKQLQFVYFAGCWTGHLEAQWRAVLGLDDAKMFDRLSFVDEHMAWVWFRSPAVIAALN